LHLKLEKENKESQAVRISIEIPVTGFESIQVSVVSIISVHFVGILK